MTNEIAKSLELLAQKLGTTSEYLWNVLLQQAPLSAVMDLIQYTIIVVACVIWGKKTKIFAAKISNGDWSDESWFWIGGLWVFLAVFIIASFFSFPNTIYAIFNPEYWALDKLLSKVNN